MWTHGPRRRTDTGNKMSPEFLRLPENGEKKWNNGIDIQFKKNVKFPVMGLRMRDM